MSTSITGPLWAISEHLFALLDTVDLAEPEQKADIEAEIQRYVEASIQKADHIAEALSICESTATAAANEIKRLQDRKRAAEAAKERLSNYVVRVMESHGLRKLEGKTNTFTLRDTDSVVITDMDAVPSGFKRTTISVDADKVAIKKAIKGGASVPGADLETRTGLVRK